MKTARPKWEEAVEQRRITGSFSEHRYRQSSLRHLPGQPVHNSLITDLEQ